MQYQQIPREQMVIPGGSGIVGDDKSKGATPYFRYENIFNEPQSRIQGKAVHDLKEVVEIRFAGNPQYRPVFGVDEMYEMNDNGAIITWAERYAPQYNSFLDGVGQEAEGTPLEELTSYGISQSHLSLCRALNIYCIEALHHLEGPGLKKLGLHANTLKPMAKRWMDARADGSTAQTEINELKRKLAALTGDQPETVELSTVMPIDVPVLPDGYETMSDSDLKEEISRLTGAKPRGNPSRVTLSLMLDQAKSV